ncbi:Fe-S cluster assembly protein SufD [Latilactobacillus curvatus]|uniref:Fe-S cluster assembly protein SufD n=1 Tax=Latilactobacillus curvatus TaxID=28038 RepID=UPI0011BB581A|nr:Fe-S cluster assembly protein SufD [Latilactobacillus curvatus]QEA49850.1 Fe-S cluster assembly protein SufD [Latilactobacillus curvatus]WBY49649.1 Fe-S cluster assembly protein SufD [Latilactobacillus curvatus]WIE01705.1 Fe-S cluster assembly protein SufD [Latilactobacillus curvatus]
MKKTLAITPEQIASFSQLHQEPAWFAEMRQAAFAQIEQLELPIFEKINYKHWPVMAANAPTAVKSDLNLMPSAAANLSADQPYAVQIGQTTAKLNLPAELAEQGVIFTDIFTALQEHPDLVQQYYMQVTVKPNEDRLTAFHTALMNSGLFLYVPKNVVIKQPITAYYVQDSTQPADFIHHVLVVAEQNSEFSYLENLQTAGDHKNLANVVVEVIAKDNSHVHFSAVDAFGKSVTTYLNRRGHLMRDARIDWALGSMNDGNIIGDFDSDLVGAGSHAETKVVAISTGKQIQGIDTRVTNIGPRSIGHILQHGVILEDATLTFNGIGHILKGAKGADAQQENRVLMLSRTARGDANPLLLIDENDVQAGHAASVGRVDEQQMYYLMSRGLSKEVAQRLVIRGFLGAVLSEIPDKNVRQQLTDTIERKLIDGQPVK